LKILKKFGEKSGKKFENFEKIWRKIWQKQEPQTKSGKCVVAKCDRATVR